MYRIPGFERVQIIIYNVQGRVVKHIPDSALKPGKGSANWDGKDDAGMTVSSGLYLVVLRSGGTKIIRKVVVIRN
jgi:flagellar hook assembly protein FlgD